MRKLAIIGVSVFVGFFLYAGAVSAVSAASLKFDQTTYTGAVGDTIEADVIVDPGSDSISSTDAHVTYDATVLEAVSVTAGTYFPSVDQTITSGKVSIYASVSADSLTAKTGEGTIATVVFKVLKNGTSALDFFCDAGSYNSSKIIKDDVDATNIITCTSNVAATLTAGTGSSSGGSSTLTTPTPITALPSTGTIQDLSLISMLGMALIAIGGVIKLKLNLKK